MDLGRQPMALGGNSSLLDVEPGSFLDHHFESSALGQNAVRASAAASAIYQSLSSGGNVVESGSKTVLSALRSLQDKIKRLELERDTQMSNNEVLRSKLVQVKQEYEAAFLKEKQIYLTKEKHLENMIALLTQEKHSVSEEKMSLQAQSDVISTKYTAAKVELELLQKERAGLYERLKSLEHNHANLTQEVQRLREERLGLLETQQQAVSLRAQLTQSNETVTKCLHEKETLQVLLAKTKEMAAIAEGKSQELQQKLRSMESIDQLKMEKLQRSQRELELLQKDLERREQETMDHVRQTEEDIEQRAKDQIAEMEVRQKQMEATITELVKLNTSLFTKLSTTQERLSSSTPVLTPDGTFTAAAAMLATPSPIPKATKKRSGRPPSARAWHQQQQQQQQQQAAFSAFPYYPPVAMMPYCLRSRSLPAAHGVRCRSPTASSVYKSKAYNLYADGLGLPLPPPQAGGYISGGKLKQKSPYERLKRTSLDRTPPFVLGSTTPNQSYNAVSAAQSGLDLSTHQPLDLVGSCSAPHCHTVPSTSLLPGSSESLVEDLMDSESIQTLCREIEQEYTACYQKYLEILEKMQSVVSSTPPPPPALALALGGDPSSAAAPISAPASEQAQAAAVAVADVEDMTQQLHILVAQMNAKSEQLRKLRQIQLTQHQLLSAYKVNASASGSGSGSAQAVAAATFSSQQGSAVNGNMLNMSAMSTGLDRREKALRVLSDFRNLSS